MFEKQKTRINESGEIIRAKKAEVQESNIEFKLTEMYEALLVQSTHPLSTDQPESLFYWAGDRLTHNKTLVSELRKLITDNQVREFHHAFTDVEISLPSFLEKAEQSITYSEQITKRLEKEAPHAEEDAAAARRREIRRAMRWQKD